jgi:ATP-dependent DNA helicase RecG
MGLKMTLELKKDVRYLKGVGPIRAEKLSRLGVNTLEDLITYYPARYEDRRSIKKISMVNNGETTLIKVEVIETVLYKSGRYRRGRSLVKIKVKDSSGIAVLTAFNQSYLKESLKSGTILLVHGKFARTYGGLETSNFTHEKYKAEEGEQIHMGRIVPVYNLTSGITQNWLRKIIYENIKNLRDDFSEYIPLNIVKKEKLQDINNAIRNIHFPEKMRDIHEARKRLVLGEFILFQTALAIKKFSTKKLVKNHQYEIKRELLTPFKNKLGFEFTEHQKKVINEIFNDLISP